MSRRIVCADTRHNSETVPGSLLRVYELAAAKDVWSVDLAHKNIRGLSSAGPDGSILVAGQLNGRTGWIGQYNRSNYRVRPPLVTIGMRGTDHAPTHIPVGAPSGEPGSSSPTASVACANASSGPWRHIPARRIARPDSNEAVPSGGGPTYDPRSAMSAKCSTVATDPRPTYSHAAITASHG